MKPKKLEKKKKRRWKLETGNPRGVTGVYVKTNGKKVNI